MRGTEPRRRATATSSAQTSLRRRLESLPLAIDAASVRPAAVAVASYPGGLRPSSVVRLDGAGVSGFGEHVGWSEAEHAIFRDGVRALPLDAQTVGDWSRAVQHLPPYDRAALEAAAIDLALRSLGMSFLDFAGTDVRDVRYVVSFARCEDPVAEAAAHDGELKIDADPLWPDDIWETLASLDRLAIVDFKHEGRREDARHAARVLDAVWIEDPPAAGDEADAGGLDAAASGDGEDDVLAARTTRDIPVTSVAALDALPAKPAAVNVKAPRMGGVLEAVACLEHCAALGIATYMGGMFETDCGRRQSLLLATVFCAGSPNDIAPLGVKSRPAVLRAADAAGFGAEPS